MGRNLFARRNVLGVVGLHRFDAFLQAQVALAESFDLLMLAENLVAEFLQGALEMGEADLQFLDTLLGRHGGVFGSGNSSATTARSSWASTL